MKVTKQWLSYKIEKSLGEKRSIYKYILLYSVTFLILSSMIFFEFHKYRKSFIWNMDGLDQTYTTMAYLGEFYRNGFSQLLKGKLDFQLFDFRIGQGYDVITTLNYYGLGDPLLLFTVFFSKENMEPFYNFLTIFRFYLVGLSFSAYCISMKRSYFNTFVGAFLYCFSGYAVSSGVQHPYFLNPMIYLPLLCLGVERILHKKSIRLFSTLVFIAAISNYYFFYMLTIIVFVYAALRFLEYYKSAWRKNLFPIVAKEVLSYFIGLGLSAFLFLPAILSFMGNARGGNTLTDIFYASNYYLKFLFGFFSPAEEAGYWSILQFAPICFLCVFILFFNKKQFEENIALKIGFLLFTISLFLPWFGSFMNGFSYIVNRYVFGYAFVVALIVVYALDYLTEFTDKQGALLSLTLLILYVLLRTNPKIDIIYYQMGLVLLTITFVAVFVTAKWVKSRILWQSVILLFVSVPICINAVGKYSPQYKNFLNAFHAEGKADLTIRNTPESSIKKMKDKEFYRVGTTSYYQNAAMIMDYYGESFYYSLINQDYLAYEIALELATIPQPHRFLGYDRRAQLEILNSVKYIASDVEKDEAIPAGFQQVGEFKRENKVDTVYQNENYLPLGFTYKTAVSKSAAESLTGLELQELMMQAVILDDGQVKREQTEGIVYQEQKIPYTITASDGLTFDQSNHKIVSKKTNSSATISFSYQGNAEFYIRLKGFDITGSKKDFFYIGVKSGNYDTRFSAVSDKNRFPVHRKNHLLYIGKADGGSQTCTITFPYKGNYQLDELEVYALPTDALIQQTAKLKEEVLQQVTIKNNAISGEIALQDDKYLYLSIPYSKGWTAKVDGKKAKLVKANIMYMALPLEAGSHNIELNYATYGLRTGTYISLGTVVLCCLWVILRKRNLTFFPR